MGGEGIERSYFTRDGWRRIAEPPPLAAKRRRFNAPAALPDLAARRGALAALGAHTHPARTFAITDALIRAVYEQRGEFSAAVELRRLFPAVTDTAQARACSRTIAGCPCPSRCAL